MNDLPNVDTVRTGKMITWWMKKNRMDSFSLALILGMRNLTTIYAWRQGKHLPGIDNLVKLASIFGCEVNDLIVLEGEEKNEVFDW